MNKDIAFYCPAIHNTDYHNTIKNVLNDLSSEYNTIMFNSQYHTIDQSPRKYTVLHCNQARYFYGTIAFFDTDSLNVVKEFPGPQHKIFIASDIFWQNKMMPTQTWQMLLSKNVNVVTLDKKIYDLYSICFEKPLANMNDGLNSQEFKNVVKQLQQVE